MQRHHQRQPQGQYPLSRATPSRPPAWSKTPTWRAGRLRQTPGHGHHQRVRRQVARKSRAPRRRPGRWRRKIRSSCRPSPSRPTRPPRPSARRPPPSIRNSAPRSAAYSIEACRKNKLVAAGFFTDSTSFTASPIRTACSATSRDRPRFHLHRAHRRRPRFGLGQALGHRRRKFDAREAADVAIEKALRSVDAKALEPGRYTVILEPAATSDLLGYHAGNGFDARRPMRAAASCRRRAAATAWARSCSTSRSTSGPTRGTRMCRCCPGTARPCWRASAMDIIKDGKVANAELLAVLGQEEGRARRRHARATSSWPAPTSRPRS
jgi:hypothetical protein